jgi:AraC-like DNA-binding protein
MAHLHFERIFSSPLVDIRDVRCRPTDTGCGTEEESDDNSVVFPRAGVFLQHVGRERIVATANHVLFFKRGRPYRVSHPVPGGDDCTSMTFAPEVLLAAIGQADPARRDQPESPFRFTHGPLESKTILCLQRLRRRLRAAQMSHLEVEESALAVLHDVVRDAYQARGSSPRRQRRLTTQSHRDIVEAVKTLLAGRLAANPSLAQVARAVHASPYHLARVFREQTGLPIHQYLQRLRLAWSLEHLSNGARDLTCLALELGFSSHSHFTDSFHRQYGITPSAFRR